MSELIEPHRRATAIGLADAEARLRAMLASGAIANGWLIVGGRGAGKATLGYRLARAILDPSALASAATLDVAEDSRVFRLVAQGVHPDLFVARREYDEKTQRYQTEIPVDTIRRLNEFLSKTASAGGWRVAIVDTANDMNRQAANALLKSLEEPPAKTAMLLLASAPGRLLATIRSRCRRIDIPPAADAEIVTLLEREAGLDAQAASAIALVSGGRPGYALTLAEEEGAEVVAAVDSFIEAALARGEAGEAAPSLTPKANEAKWELFCELLLERISRAVRTLAPGGAHDAFGALPAAELLSAYERTRELLERGNALNLDKAHLLGAAARALRDARARAA